MRFGQGGAACHKRSVRQRRSGGFVPNERALSLQLGTDPRRETAGRERQPQENWEENPLAGSVWKRPGSPSRPARRVCPRCPPRGPRRPSRVRTPARLAPPGATEAARQSRPRPRARGSCGLRLCKGANGPRRGVRLASARHRVTRAERGRRGHPGRTFDEGARGGEAARGGRRMRTRREARPSIGVWLVAGTALTLLQTRGTPTSVRASSPLSGFSASRWASPWGGVAAARHRDGFAVSGFSRTSRAALGGRALRGRGPRAARPGARTPRTPLRRRRGPTRGPRTSSPSRAGVCLQGRPGCPRTVPVAR